MIDDLSVEKRATLPSAQVWLFRQDSIRTPIDMLQSPSTACLSRIWVPILERTSCGKCLSLSETLNSWTYTWTM